MLDYLESKAVKGADDCVYSSPCGFAMRRERGLTPNGNPVGGRWVLRNQNGEYVDVDQYRYDLVARHGFCIAYSEQEAYLERTTQTEQEVQHESA